ncbi:MAG: phosphoribosylglycinamide formyltransferase [Phycisphaerales bacterium]
MIVLSGVQVSSHFSQTFVPRLPPFLAGDPARLVVMISGGGRTLGYLAEAVAQGRLAARIAGVISSTPAGSAGYERAVALGVPVAHLPGAPTAAELERQVAAWRGDFVVLAGYLKKVGVPTSLRGRIVNIHPALLPRFGGKGLYGLRVHEAVLASGETETGCTVHVVDEEYDRGPIVLRRTCAVERGDTPETLAARVFEQERVAYVDALNQLIAGKAALSSHSPETAR